MTLSNDKSSWGLPIKVTYGPKDVKGCVSKKSIEKPGSYPYTRGIYPQMYRARQWTMRQYTGFGNTEATNQRFKFLIDQGQTGLSVAFDLPTQLGYDSDSPRAEGEVGRVGVPISSIEDMQLLFDGIGLLKVSTSMTINATAAVMLAMYASAGEHQGCSMRDLRGTTQNDILKEYIARNTYIFPPKPSLKIAVDIIEFCMTHMPLWHPISISGYHIREAGANAAQELAFTFANAKEYVRTCVARGLNIDQFAPHLSFFFACQNDFLEEIAKFRAARRIWASIVKNDFGATRRDSMKLRFHTQTSGETLTAQQPQNNIVRVAIQALAAVLGGTQSLHTNSMDEALSLPTEEAVKIALRTQQIIANETGVTKTADPIGGSYYVEYLTEKIEGEAMKELRKIERLGGSVKAIQIGYIQKKIRESAFAQQVEAESGTKKIVGVNIFTEPEPPQIRIHRINETETKRQISRLKSFRQRRNQSQVDSSLRLLENAAERNDNLIPSIVKSVQSRATTGEVVSVLRGVYGEYRPQSNF